MDQDTISDPAALTVVCPTCHADVDQPCPRRPAPHPSRVKRAVVGNATLWRPGGAVYVFVCGLDGITVTEAAPPVRVPYPPRPDDPADALARMPYANYLQTPEWRERRLAALERAHYRCQVCYGSLYLQVHHRTYERRGREWPEDLTVLCDACHALFHGKMPKSPSDGRRF